jgi:diguanylate cyclase (GGDEF)-like protein/PAS domain S-box-containing protein
VSTAAAPPRDELRALRAELAQFRRVCDAVPVAIAYYERDGHICRYANQGYARMFGCTPQSVLGRTVAQVIGAEAARFIQPQVDRVLGELISVRYERELPGEPAVDGGLPRHIEVHLLPHVDDQGQAIGAFVLISDISRHRRAESALRLSEERLAKFMQASDEGIVFHQGGLITDANPPLLELVGRSLAEVVGRPALSFVAPEARPQVAEVMGAGRETRYDTALLHRDGRAIPVEFSVRTLQFQGHAQRMTRVRDIRARLAAEARIRQLAQTDPLTGLLNRAAFDEQVTLRLAEAQAQGRKLALLFIDLDHFKRVNDSLGHPVGDALLRTVAARIAAALRDDDLVCRFGGDEFVLLLQGVAHEDAVDGVARKLVRTVGEPVDLDGTAISVTPSIGVALFPAHGRTAAELVRNADTAMYRAKARGRAGHEFFQQAMLEAARAELALEAELAQAVSDEAFELHYQPQVDAASGALMGIEALLRWRHPQRGLVGPEHFLPLAEARRLILPMGHWVLVSALKQSLHWHRAGLARVPVAVNLSALQFGAPGFAQDVARTLAATGAEGPMLELEITERMLMEDIDAVRATLEPLRALGLRVAVDDFGTGFTSLRHLMRLPLDRLKIDRGFVEGLPHDSGAAAVADAVIGLARGLGLEVVAEGVETPAQREHLLQRGCRVQQGLLHGAPMPAAQLAQWLQQRRLPALGIRPSP